MPINNLIIQTFVFVKYDLFLYRNILNMTTQEIAIRLHELCNQGKYETAQKELYADNAISIEPKGAVGFPEMVEGLDAIIAKGNAFESMIEEYHSISAGEPIVSENFIAMTIDIDATMKGFGRVPMSEIAVYEVRNGKISKEQFFYSTKQ
jgi:hypothetical protein